MHTLTLGITLSGKSYLSKMLAGEFRRRGQAVAVLDPIGSRWPADFQTDDADDFQLHAVLNKNLRIFVDEGGDFFATHGEKLIWLATKGRHFGHVSTFIATRYSLIPKTVRANCTTLYLFASHPDDVDELSKDFRCPELRELAADLKQGEFVLVRQFQKPRRGRINFARGTVEIEKR